MNSVIKAALSDWRTLNESEDWWATFEAFLTDDDRVVVRLDYGVIHHNGFKESTLRTFFYYETADGGSVLGEGYLG